MKPALVLLSEVIQFVLRSEGVLTQQERSIAAGFEGLLSMCGLLVPGRLAQRLLRR